MTTYVEARANLDALLSQTARGTITAAALKTDVLALFDAFYDEHVAVTAVADLTDGGGYVRMTSAERTKLSALVANYKGVYVDLAALTAAVATASAGDWAIITHGSGGVATVAAWDSDASPAAWVDTATSNLGTIDWANITSKPATLLKSDTTATLTAGFKTTIYDNGTKTSGTLTPDQANGGVQKVINGGAFTLDPPSATDGVTLILDITNNGSAGAITTSGFTKVTGDAFDTTNAHAWRCFISKSTAGSHLHKQAMF